ncbi:MAG: hypothetical protein ACOCQR_01730 [bacterium]
MKCKQCNVKMIYANTTGRGFDIGLCEKCEWDPERLKFEKGQRVIFEIEDHDFGTSRFVGHIKHIFPAIDKFTVGYLEGYKDRNDRIDRESIVALVDETKQCPYYETEGFKGHLIPNPHYKPREEVK